MVRPMRHRQSAGRGVLSVGSRRPPRPAVALLAAVLASAVSGCGGSDDEADAAPQRTSASVATEGSTTEPEATTTTLDPEEVARQEVIDAADAASQARAASAAPPNPDPNHPDLHATHTGAMLDQWIDTVEILVFNGFAIRYPEPSQHQRIVDSVTFDEVDGQQVAFLEVCTVEDGERFSMVTGDVFTSGARTVQATEAMRNEGGAWKLAERRENNTWEGVAGCAAD
jgi:hypothetical protein